MRNLRRFSKSPKTALIIGIILLTCGILETTESVIEDILHLEIGVHHGVILFALSHIFIAIIHMLDGAENIEASQLEKQLDEEI